MSSAVASRSSAEISLRVAKKCSESLCSVWTELMNSELTVILPTIGHVPATTSLLVLEQHFYQWIRFLQICFSQKLLWFSVCLYLLCKVRSMPGLEGEEVEKSCHPKRKVVVEVEHDFLFKERLLNFHLSKITSGMCNWLTTR